MKLTKSYLKKVIKEELKNLSEEGEEQGAAPQPKLKGDVEKISKVMEKLPQLQRLFGLINTEDELSQVLDNLISGVAGAEIMHEKVDQWLGKWASRKLIVWGTSTVFLAAGSLTSSDWVAVSLAYIGLQGAADIAAKWKHG
jgi:hypothetical protein